MAKFLMWSGGIGLCLAFPPLIFVALLVWGLILWGRRAKQHHLPDGNDWNLSDENIKHLSDDEITQHVRWLRGTLTSDEQRTTFDRRIAEASARWEEV